MFAASGDLRIYYDTFGTEGDPPLLLVCGLGSQVLFWREEFCYGLVDRGFFVVRVDNRDGGLSSELPPEASYTLSDMAADLVAVIDDLGIDRVHIVGQSLGGMIAQTFAIEHPTRVITLTSISSHTGNLDFGRPSPEALNAMMSASGATRDEQIERDVAARRVWASPSWFDEEEARAYFSATYDRAHSATGSTRQFNAIVASGSRDEALRSLTVPTLVVHGTLDPLIAPDGGSHTAELIPGAELLMIEGMGHDLPVEAWQQIISAITAMVARSA
jgi:pimeloyl-ACP methyl ester carboxylesterase